MKATMIATGGLSGGISATIAGGNFWDGFRQGIITSGLNHVAHMIATPTALEYNDKSLTKWARETFKGVEGADKIKVKTGEAPKGRVYQDGKYMEKINMAIIQYMNGECKMEINFIFLSIHLSKEFNGFIWLQDMN